MRIPIILALLVIITLPRDVHALADSVSAQMQVATAAVTRFFDRSEEPVQVAALSQIQKSNSDTQKGLVGNLR